MRSNYLLELFRYARVFECEVYFVFAIVVPVAWCSELGLGSSCIQLLEGTFSESVFYLKFLVLIFEGKMLSFF